MQDRQKISIHALREEGDYRHHGRRSSGAISIHALREEGDLLVLAGGVLAKVFLSTPSARRATEMSGQGSFVPTISIHALREEGDAPSTSKRLRPSPFLSTPSARRATCTSWTALPSIRFLSTPSARRATFFNDFGIPGYLISIHALREEGDPMMSCRSSLSSYFYPRPPRGGRLHAPDGKHPLRPYFYPRPPRGGRRPCRRQRPRV